MWLKVNQPPKTLGILTKVFCTCGPNVAILPWTGDVLSHSQAVDSQTHIHTHIHTEAEAEAEAANDNIRKSQLASSNKSKIN